MHDGYIHVQSLQFTTSVEAYISTHVQCIVAHLIVVSGEWESRILLSSEGAVG